MTCSLPFEHKGLEVILRLTHQFDKPYLNLQVQTHLKEMVPFFVSVGQKMK